MDSEQLLETALLDWIPRSITAQAEAKAVAGRALKALAGRLGREHGDLWLADLLASNGGPAYRAGLEALSQAVAANRSGQRNRGMMAASKARRLFDQSGNSAGALRAGLEQVYAFSRSFQPQDCLREAALISRDPRVHQYKWVWGQLHLERSMCAARLGDFESSQRFMQVALGITRQSGYSTLHLRALGLNASLETSMGNIPASWKENWNGVELFWKGTHPAMRAYQFYSELSHAAERDREWYLGHLLAAEAVSMSVVTGNRLMEAMARYRLAMFATNIGRRDETLLELKKASDLLAWAAEEPSIRVYSAESAIAVSAAWLETDDLQAAEKLILSVDRTGIEGSFLIQFAYHRTLGLIHYRRGRLIEAQRELWKAVDLAKRAGETIESAREHASWKRETASVYRTLVRIALEGKNPRNAFYIWEQYRSVALQTANVGAAPMTTAALANAAASHNASSVLAWAQFHDGLAAWVFDDRGLEFHWIDIGKQQLDQLCTRFVRLCSRRGSDVGELTRTSRALYDVLIRPLVDKLQPGRLMLIEPDGPIAGVPFEALMDGSGRWLADRFEVVTSPGLWSEIRLRAAQQEIDPQLRALAVWNPVLSAELTETYPPLTDAETEANAVAGYFRAHELLTGTAATVAAVKESLTRAQVFHFAGHGIATGESGGLLLAGNMPGQEAILGSALLSKVPNQCRLAVLSACSTASGEQDGTGNPDSLVQAFWRAGVSNVIASRWDVDSGHAAAFFSKFYDSLRSEQSVKVAVARTAAQFRRQRATSHPHYWVAFHVFGCANPRRR